MWVLNKYVFAFSEIPRSHILTPSLFLLSVWTSPGAACCERPLVPLTRPEPGLGIKLTMCDLQMNI